MKLKNIIQAGAGLLGFIALFFAWYKFSYWGMTARANAFEVSTAIAVISLLVSLGAIGWFVLDMLGLVKLEEKVKKIVATAIGGVMVLMSIIGMIYVSSKASGFGGAGFGTWLYLIMGVVIIVLTWVKLDKTVGKAINVKVTGASPKGKK